MDSMIIDIDGFWAYGRSRLHIFIEFKLLSVQINVRTLSTANKRRNPKLRKAEERKCCPAFP
jgi:hypothetical protein